MEADEMTVKDLIMEGLITDGAHHKQWYLEQIASKLGLAPLLVEMDHEEGVAP